MVRASVAVATAFAGLLPAGAARAHIIYATDFEPGAYVAGPIEGQDLWTDTPGNPFRVSPASPIADAYSLRLNAADIALGGGSVLTRETMQIGVEPVPGMMILNLSTLLRIENADAGSNPAITIEYGWTAGLATFRVTPFSITLRSAFTGEVFATTTPAGTLDLLAEIDLLTGVFTGYVNGQAFGTTTLPTDQLQNQEDMSGVRVTGSVSGPASYPQVFVLDSMMLRHIVPAPGAASLAAAGCVAALRRRRFR